MPTFGLDKSEQKALYYADTLEGEARFQRTGNKIFDKRTKNQGLNHRGHKGTQRKSSETYANWDGISEVYANLG